MPTYVALLRGINVGGRNKVAMADLRELMTSLGHGDVTTYIQSGNVVFTSPKATAARLAGAIEKAIAAELGVAPRVVVLSRDELAKVVADNPFPGEKDPKKVHAVFLDKAPGRDVVSDVDALVARAADKGGRDEATVVGRVLYLHTPDGYGRSELAALLLRSKRLTAAGATARNWSTVTKLLSLCER